MFFLLVILPDHVIRGILLAVRPGRAQRVRGARALVKVRFMPGVNSHDMREVARVEMIFKSALLVGDDIEAALAPEGFERGRQSLKLGARSLRLLAVDGTR